MPLPQPFRFETRIRFIDTDASGRIHYTCLFRYFESAEIEFMRSLGIVYNRSDYSFPRVHAECDYRLALIHDDEIRIDVVLSKLGRSSARLDFQAWKANDLAAHGHVIVVCMDRTTQQSIAIPDHLRQKLEAALRPDPQTLV